METKIKNSLQWIELFGMLVMGFMIGIILSYKVEANTINQAMDSLDFCYKNYAIPYFKYAWANNITFP